jgi:uncharacterized protein YxjI
VRYILRQRFSLHDRYTIKDEAGNDAFLVTGKAIEMVRTHSLQDLNGNELMLIKHKPMSLKPTFELHEGENAVGLVKKEGALKTRFVIELSSGENIEVTGKLLKYEWTFEQNGRQVAVSRKFARLKDHFVVDVADEKDAVLVLSSAVAIESILVWLRDRQQ